MFRSNFVQLCWPFWVFWYQSVFSVFLVCLSREKKEEEDHLNRKNIYHKKQPQTRLLLCCYFFVQPSQHCFPDRSSCSVRFLLPLFLLLSEQQSFYSPRTRPSVTIGDLPLRKVRGALRISTRFKFERPWARASCVEIKRFLHTKERAFGVRESAFFSSHLWGESIFIYLFE